ncbi:hypothetical protein [Pseudomonas schmalbachii]|uniref:Uncharacterized protein n=1 Tax=Pseudomonas schmalbachii TaxID=2816993 RepID=A0ABS3TNA9_9PSED|nr:hypothetical protein [Pseudomonas schmalbachii]MBO3274170.1 hypothetical protein [Pseudomonas schmalbachii]
MTDLHESADEFRQQHQERYLHKPTGQRWAAVAFIGSVVQLEDVGGRRRNATSQELQNRDVWERIP